MRNSTVVATLVAGGVLAACGGSGSGPCTPGGDGGYLEGPYQRLSDYCLVELTDAGIVPLPGVLPYDLNTPLFSDYAMKVRTVWMPDGSSAAYDPDTVVDFPEGTLISKSFGLPDDLRKAVPNVRWIETRILTKANGTWHGYAYLWNDAGTDATLFPSGEVFPTTLIGYDGETINGNYLVPSQNQCKQCHQNDQFMEPIGPKARQLNKDYAYGDGVANQLVRWTQVGYLTGAPDPSVAPKLPVWNDPATGTVEQRARAYLEGNCAHCHNGTGAAANTGLTLWASETDPQRYGVCKTPVAAGPATGGFDFDIVPGDPDHSIMTHRIESTQSGIMMPPLSRSVVDSHGTALVAEWVSGLPGSCQ